MGAADPRAATAPQRLARRFGKIAGLFRDDRFALGKCPVGSHAALLYRVGKARRKTELLVLLGDGRAAEQRCAPGAARTLPQTISGTDTGSRGSGQRQ